MSAAATDAVSSAAFKRERGRKLINIAIEIGVNFAAPLLVYDSLENGFGDVIALAASGLPPLLWALTEFLRHRRIDAISLFVFASIILSLAALAGGGSVRMLQLRENLVVGAIGLLLIASVVIRRPIAYEFARAGIARKSPEEAAAFEAKRNSPRFRQSMAVMTLVWGLGLLASTAAACALVFRLTIREYMVVSPFITYGTMGLLGVWTALYVRHVRNGAKAPAEQASAP